MQIHKHHFTTIDSTNRFAMANEEGFTPDALTLITADEQTAGKGQYGKTWLSSKGNLYATYCLFLPLDRSDFSLMTFIMAEAVARLLEEEGLSPQLKWPNDLLVDGKKISGILSQSREKEKWRFLAVGVGLNVNIDAASLKEVGQPATSLSIELGRGIEVKEVLEKLTPLFLSLYNRFLQEGSEFLLSILTSRGWGDMKL